MRFTVYGTPQAQPRAKARNFGTHAAVYNPKTADTWKALIILAARAADGFAACPMAGPLRVDATWYLPRPKRLMRKKDLDGPVWHLATPDRDNLDKAVLDALVQAGVMRDDAQVCAGQLLKLYAEKTGTPRAVIAVETQKGLF
jgi:Holliday junction resolvase RusA-like endonuclease